MGRGHFEEIKHEKKHESTGENHSGLKALLAGDLWSCSASTLSEVALRATWETFKQPSIATLASPSPPGAPEAGAILGRLWQAPHAGAPPRHAGGADGSPLSADVQATGDARAGGDLALM